MKFWRVTSFLMVCGSTVAAICLPAAAQEEAATSLSIELNGLQATEEGCRLTFVAANRLNEDITRAAYELAFFNEKGLVERLTVLDFQSLPADQTKVRQFDLPDLDCGNLERILVNDATACEATDTAVCMERLETTARDDAVVFGQ